MIRRHPALRSIWPMTLGFLAVGACEANDDSSPGAGGAGGLESLGGAGGGSSVCTTPAEEDLEAYLIAASELPPGGPAGPGGGTPGPGGAGGLGPGGGGPGTGGDGGGPEAISPIEPVENEFGSAENGFGSLNVLIPLTPLGVAVGTNGRHCETCHANQGGWTIRPETIVRRFELGEPHFDLNPRFPTNAEATTNDELEPLFRVNDGANSPDADVSTAEARALAYSMLLSRGVFRIGLKMPDSAEFELAAVDDPYGYASQEELSLYRRPNLMANLRFHPSVMWDGRETTDCLPLTADLEAQANAATRGHAQANADLTVEQRLGIVGAEISIYFAQSEDAEAGRLDEAGGRGGPFVLADQPFYVGMNAFDGSDPEGKPFDPAVFTLYDAWLAEPGDTPASAARARIARGEALFNSRSFVVEGVSGFNDELGQPSITTTCGGCHDTPNAGTSSRGKMMDLGVSSAARAGVELPIYTFRNTATGDEIETTDPGRALVSGRWKDINRFKVPILRGNAVRPPYLHDGSAKTLADAVRFHDERFSIGLTPDEIDALVHFLAAL